MALSNAQLPESRTRRVLIGLALLFSLGAQAQSLKPGQLATVCTAVKTNGTANAARLAGDTTALLAWLNADASPAQLVWRADVAPIEADEAANYVTFDGLTAGKRDSWKLFLAYTRDYGRNKVRSWVTDIWGNATAGSVGEAVLLAGTRNGRNVEIAIGGTSKTTNAVTALDTSFDGAATQADATWLVQSANCN